MNDRAHDLYVGDWGLQSILVDFFFFLMFAHAYNVPANPNEVF